MWDIDWNVNCQAVGEGEASLRYLARYVFKVAISPGRLVHADHQSVRFRYRKVRSNRVRTLTLPVIEFMRRFLQHVLPTGFMKVRYYGFLSPSSSLALEELKARVEMAHGFALQAPKVEPEASAPLCSPPLRRGAPVLAPHPAGQALGSRPHRLVS